MDSKWRQVTGPKKWRPNAGDVLEGVYLYVQDNDGPFGQYRAHIIQSGNDLRYVTASVLNHLMRSVRPGTVVRIVCTGVTETAAGHDMKTFNLFVADPTSKADDADQVVDLFTEGLLPGDRR